MSIYRFVFKPLGRQGLVVVDGIMEFTGSTQAVVLGPVFTGIGALGDTDQEASGIEAVVFTYLRNSTSR